MDFINYNTPEFLENPAFTPNPHHYITVRGARENNLKNENVIIPKNCLTVVSGLSGSGKSSLVFDTIYAEGQRRYVESLSSYARQFLGLKEKPDVDSIDGLSPAISIDQKSTSQNPRSTVGTTTEIYDYVRLLYGKIGVQHCSVCDAEITVESVTTMAERVLKNFKDQTMILLAPIVQDQKGWHKQQIVDAKQANFKRLRVDGKIILIDEAEKIELNKNEKHSIEIVVDRITVNEENRLRLIDSLELSLQSGGGRAVALTYKESGEEVLTYFNKNRACPNGHGGVKELEARQFSFNSPHGACTRCSGLGTITQVDPELVVPNGLLSVAEGAIKPFARSVQTGSWLIKILDDLAKRNKFSTTIPWKELTKKQQDTVLYGDSKWEGVITNLERRYKETTSDSARSDIESYMTKMTCPECNGARLNKESLAVTVGGSSINQVTSLPIDEALEHFRTLPDRLQSKDREISRLILKEVISRLKFLTDVGLSYLSLSRSANTLSGGEAQRIRLATQIGSGLTGVLYILDEPSIGLHQRDNTKLLNTLKNLRDIGNTVIVVEHDEETIREADFLVDVGPKAGIFGGKIVATGTPAEVSKNLDSPTGRFLAGIDRIETPENRRKVDFNKDKFITIKNATEHNLKNVTVDIPLKKFVSITGVSGSGKSTLINSIFANSLMNHFYDSRLSVGKHDSIEGLNNIDKPVIIDQSPIGRTPRSNPATYTGIFTFVRDLFTELPESKARGYNTGRFSFNVQGGRCESCKGDGMIKVEMNFLPDVYVVCDDCQGKRYNRETLEIKYKEKTISDILEMKVNEAEEFFRHNKPIHRKLKTLQDVGLGYIGLGQPATTLSGGEAQRIKLATELSKIGTGNTLYILDEPTTGLHVQDVKLLLDVLHKLVEKGNTVVVIEHNLDVIKTADWLIDLGPEGGDKGGLIVGTGTPEDIAQIQESYTGKYLKDALK